MLRTSITSRLVAAGVAAVGVMALAGVPAGAATPATFTVAGGGTIIPGLTVGGSPGQTWSFSGGGYALSFNYVGPIGCTWSGNDTIGTLSQSAGGFSGQCTTLVGTETLAGTYTRAGGELTMSGTIGPAPYTGGFTAVCAFVPGPPGTTTPAVTTYQESCSFYTQ